MRTDISVGSKVEWSSAAGVLTGTVKSIRIDLNGAGEMIPWVVVDRITNLTENKTLRQDYSIMLCGTHGYMVMMKMRKIA